MLEKQSNDLWNRTKVSQKPKYYHGIMNRYNDEISLHRSESRYYRFLQKNWQYFENYINLKIMLLLPQIPVCRFLNCANSPKNPSPTGEE